MFAYPDQYPYDESQLVVRRLRGDTAVGGADLAHAAWALQGFAQSQTLPLAQQMQASPGKGQGAPSQGQQLTEDELADHLDHACHLHQQGQHPHQMKAAAGGAFPWADVLTTLIPLLSQWWHDRHPPQPTP